MTDRAPSEARAEHRWPVVVALAIAVVLYALLPSTFVPWIRWVVVGVAVLALIPVVMVNPVRFTRQTSWSRQVQLGQIIVLLVANNLALAQLVVQLISPADGEGPALLLAAVQVWATNVIVFGAMFWELDRGGPVSRTQAPRDQLPAADFRFPQDEDHDAIREVAARSSATTNWTASYLDYLYFSLSNSMAFSPTDAMPLSHRAKALMGVEAFAGFVILALVIARAVSLIG